MLNEATKQRLLYTVSELKKLGRFTSCQKIGPKKLVASIATLLPGCRHSSLVEDVLANLSEAEQFVAGLLGMM